MKPLTRYSPKIETEEGDAYVAFLPDDQGNWLHVSEALARIAELEVSYGFAVHLLTKLNSDGESRLRLLAEMVAAPEGLRLWGDSQLTPGKGCGEVKE